MGRSLGTRHSALRLHSTRSRRTQRPFARVGAGSTESSDPRSLPKCATGINGLDEVTGGGLPRGRPTLVCGTAGCGKTLLAMEFVVRGATQYHEPGVFVSFEESEPDLTSNMASLGFDLKRLAAHKQVLLDHVRIERREIEDTGEYDLEGLFIRLGYAIDSIGAKRVALDTIESLFASLPNPSILRAELRRLFAWLKSKGVTAVVTAERGENTFTRHGLEEYVADCVILLDHRVTGQMSTRRLRVVKYRGSAHGSNEYPFLIGADGFSILPITSLGLDHPASSERVSTGIPRLDHMLGGKGYFRGGTVLISGASGSGKTSLAAAFADAACRRGERCVYFASEESAKQMIRNMRSIGIDLEPWVKRRRLHFHMARPTLQGLEMHLVTMHALINQVQPAAVVVDPITNLTSVGAVEDVKAMLTRLIDFLKVKQITLVCTSLTGGDSSAEQTEVGVSSLMDTWVLLRNIENDGERNRGLYILKSRGMAHSNQIRELQLSDHGIDLADVYVGPGRVLSGAARLAQEARDRVEAAARRQESARRQRAFERKRNIIEAQIAALRSELETEEEEARGDTARDALVTDALVREQAQLSRTRMADVATPHNGGAKRGS